MLRVVDIRGKVLPPGTKPRYLPKRGDYEAAHVPGAVFVDWTRDIVDPSDPVPMQVAAPDAFAAKMSELGIGDDTLVVAYDDYDHIFAGRLAWALRYYGHDAVRVLDGGWARWMAEGRPTSRDARVRRRRRSFTARARPALRRTADEVAAALGRADVAPHRCPRRPTSTRARCSAAAQRGPHPGRRSTCPTPRSVDATTGRFLAPSDLARAFRGRASTSRTSRAKSSSTATGGLLHRASATHSGCSGATTSLCTTAPGTSGARPQPPHPQRARAVATTPHPRSLHGVRPQRTGTLPGATLSARHCGPHARQARSFGRPRRHGHRKLERTPSGAQPASWPWNRT